MVPKIDHMKTRSKVEKDPWPKIRLRWGRILALIFVLPPFFAYAGSYTYVSRRGMQEAQAYNMKGFLYVPMEEVFATQDLSQHEKLAKFYAPANWVDRTFFDGDGPIVCILWGLSKETAEEPGASEE
jgi:hypothetical protein